MLSGPKAPFQGPVYLTSNPLLPATWVEGALLLALGTFVGLPFKPVGVVVCFAWVVAFIYGKRRWQVYALDVAAAAIAAFVWLPAWLPAEFVVYFRGFIAVLLAAGLVANALMPVPSLPKPTGPYSVAVHDVFLQRNGLEFRTRVLYPAKLSKHAEPVPCVATPAAHLHLDARARLAPPPAQVLVPRLQHQRRPSVLPGLASGGLGTPAARWHAWSAVV